MTTLTNKIRNEIVDNAIARKLKAPRAELLGARYALADALFDNAYGKDEQRIIAALKRTVDSATFSKWFSLSDTIAIGCTGFHYYTRPDSDEVHAHLKLTKPRFFPDVIGSDLNIGKGHVMYDQCQALVTQHQAVRALEKAVRSEVRSMLAQFTTVEKLLEAWPEGKKLLPKIEVKQRALVDPKVIANTNKLLELP